MAVKVNCGIQGLSWQIELPKLIGQAKSQNYTKGQQEGLAATWAVVHLSTLQDRTHKTTILEEKE